MRIVDLRLSIADLRKTYPRHGAVPQLMEMPPLPSLDKEGLAAAGGCCRGGSSGRAPRHGMSALPQPPPLGSSAPASSPRPEAVKTSPVGTRCRASATENPTRTRSTASLPTQVRDPTEFFHSFPRRGARGASLKCAQSLFVFLLVLGSPVVSGLSARPNSAPATVLNGTPAVQAVDVIGMTVGDMDRSVEFFTNVLRFEKVSDVEVTGRDYERLQGLFGLRMRVVRMKLGGESIELTEYLAPRGRAFPSDTRSNDHWFQHVAIIVNDMDKAYRTLRQHKVQHASSGPQRLPDWNKNAGGIQAFYFRDPDGHFLEILQFPEGKGD
ncbi:MAG TPA: VOC family protein, partial [Terriglobia bacterium]|nr:VOC family protein [Terriglobia bacterium]